MAIGRRGEAGTPPGTASGTEGVAEMPLDGGRLSLDFVNTLHRRGSTRPEESVRAYEDLLVWALHAGLLHPAARDDLRSHVASRPDAARGALARALALREALYRLFTALLAGTAPEAAHQALLNAELARGSTAWELSAAGGPWRWMGEEDPCALLRPIAWCAATLLASPHHARVRACGEPACGRLFLDQSRNGTRRWCSMTGCGNRAKARRHYARHKGRETGSQLPGTVPAAHPVPSAAPGTAAETLAGPETVGPEFPHGPLLPSGPGSTSQDP